MALIEFIFSSFWTFLGTLLLLGVLLDGIVSIIAAVRDSSKKVNRKLDHSDKAWSQLIEEIERLPVTNNNEAEFKKLVMNTVVYYCGYSRRYDHEES